MALKNCPECGKEISDKATSCPNCGYSEVKCIKCGSNEIQPISGMSKAGSVFLWGPFAAGKILSKYKCKKCGHNF